jgi:hypothetical protein
VKCIVIAVFAFFRVVTPAGRRDILPADESGVEPPPRYGFRTQPESVKTNIHKI